MVDTVIGSNTTVNTGISMSGTDTLTVEALGTLSVNSSAVAAASFIGRTSNGIVTNSGLIENTGAFGRAILIGSGVGSSLVITITNTAGATIRGYREGITFEFSSLTNGILTVNNSGVIQSTGAILFGEAAVDTLGAPSIVGIVSNFAGGQILSDAGTAVRIFGYGTVTNSGEITGGSAAGSSAFADGVQVFGSATVTNKTGGAITADKDGVIGVSSPLSVTVTSTVTVVNESGATITGGSGSGVWLDASGSVTNDGTIEGQAASAIRFTGGQANVVDNGGTLTGGGGTAILLGGGNDTLKLRDGSTITGVSDGRAGTDLIDYTARTGGVAADLLSGVATGTGGVKGFENVTGSGQNDVISGSQLGNVLNGGGGHDRLTGRSGNDTLDGGEGNDMINGGNDADILIGGNGVDTLDTRTSGANQRIDLLASTISGGDSNGDTISGFENVTAGSGNDEVLGSHDANALRSGSGNDLLSGRRGSDTLDGGAGNDTIIGGNDADILIGGNGIDTLVTRGSGADQMVDLLANTISGGDSNGDTISGFENVTAGSGNDQISGNDDKNVMSGGDGNDVLRGNGGADLLAGGAGPDRFVFASIADSSAGSGRDQIQDFGIGGPDLIDLGSIDAISGGADDAFFFIGTDAFTGTAGELRFSDSFFFVLVEADVNGDGFADLQIELAGLTGGTAVMAADFVL